MLGDVNVAEPKALIGFAGPRVIEQTIRQTLPEGFQRSEFLLAHGMLDLVVDRREMKATIGRLLHLFMDDAAPARRRARGRAGRIRSADPSQRRPLRSPPRHGPRELEARPHPHPRAGRRARPPGAGLPDRPHRRHQRQGIGGGDGRARLARRRPSHRALHLTAPGAARGARRHRRHSGRRGRLREGDRRRARGRGRLPRRRPPRRQGDLLRSHDRRRLRAAAAGTGRRRRHRSRPRRPSRRHQRL